MGQNNEPHKEGMVGKWHKLLHTRHKIPADILYT